MRFLVFLAAPQVPFWQDGRFSLALTGMLLAGVLLVGAMVVACFEVKVLWMYQAMDHEEIIGAIDQGASYRSRCCTSAF